MGGTAAPGDAGTEGGRDPPLLSLREGSPDFFLSAAPTYSRDALRSLGETRWLLSGEGGAVRGEVRGERRVDGEERFVGRPGELHVVRPVLGGPDLLVDEAERDEDSGEGDGLRKLVLERDPAR